MGGGLEESCKIEKNNVKFITSTNVQISCWFREIVLFSYEIDDR